MLIIPTIHANLAIQRLNNNYCISFPFKKFIKLDLVNFTKTFNQTRRNQMEEMQNQEAPKKVFWQ